MRPRPAARDDEGFTLIELLMSTAILGVILGAITTAFLVFLSTGAKTSARDDHSAGGALLASYLDRDLASADTFVPPPYPAACSVPGAVAGTQVRLQWTEATATPANPVPAPGDVHRVTYALVPVAASVGPPAQPATRTLVRKLCGPSGDSTTTILTSLASTTALTATTSGTCPVPGSSRVRISLPSYQDDSTDAYRYGGCVKGRIK